jgi:hypothetical protein
VKEYSLSDDLAAILGRLQSAHAEPRGRIDPPFLYLDPEAVLHLFQSLTGLDRPPRIQTGWSPKNGPASGGFAAVPDPEAGPPLQALYQAMSPLLDQRIPMARTAEDLNGREGQWVRLSGRLQTTRFPDGRLNLAIGLPGIWGLLFYHPGHFHTLTRPLLGEDRFHALGTRVEALVYVQGPIQRVIFYHQTYGDNQEHDWLPLSPVVIRPRPAGSEADEPADDPMNHDLLTLLE